MAGAIEKIEQDLAKMDEKVAQLREETHKVYNSYLEILGNAVRQQLVLAAYQICTHTYPDRFLNLSVSEREKLQKFLRQVAARTQEEIASLLENLPAASEIPASEWQNEAAAETETETDSHQDTASENDKQQATSSPNGEAMEWGDTQSTDLRSQLLGEDPVHPFAKWLEMVESAISNVLHNSSYQANHVLKEAGVLMPELPDPLLEMAVHSSANADTSGPPNVIRLYVQAEAPPESQESQKKSEPVPITVIALHLGELEFAEPQVMAQRNQLRQLISQFSQLKQAYEQKQQEWLVATAEANWRAIWFEESHP
ncbi:hypothetical protein [Geitlerinema sp. PCC 9228]|uniref:hypothetical protein n=1 Tax=Geitlerinema sp. PCC 9228 TaxID=111611 RepID=UPI0008F9BFC5|nr:hypothetical protein [Geitlerinema sp. PCC 9228]